MSAFAVLAPIIATGAQGRWRLTLGITSWYLVVLAVLESPNLEPNNLVHAAWTWALVLCIGLLLAAGLDRIRGQRLASERRRETELLEQRRTIARELHDTISHTATLSLLRATAAREHLDDPDLISTDLDYLTDACQQMTVDLRSLLTAIRGPNENPVAEAPTSPPAPP
nr:histidine kinase dimerization/phosphoacceptor domain-containing protein [Tessaracoccus coleopterorum]